MCPVFLLCAYQRVPAYPHFTSLTHTLTHQPHSPHQTTLYLSASQHLSGPQALWPTNSDCPCVLSPPPYIEMNIALCLSGSNTAVAPCPASCLFTHTSSAALIAVCPAGAMSAPALSRAFCLAHPPVLAIVPFLVYRFLVLLPVVGRAYRTLSLMLTASNAGPATVCFMHANHTRCLSRLTHFLPRPIETLLPSFQSCVLCLSALVNHTSSPVCAHSNASSKLRGMHLCMRCWGLAGKSCKQK